MPTAKAYRLLLVAALLAPLVLSSGCATETGRSTVGGLVYGSMVGTTIAPGIGSAIGAGVGLLAGVLEGSQREHEKKTSEEAYREKFYRLRDNADETAAPHEGGPSTPGSPSQSERFSNLIALQEREPLVGQIEKEAERAPVSIQTREPQGELNPSEGDSGSELSRVRTSELYSELAELRRDRRKLEDRVGRLAALLEEYDRGGRKSPMLIEQMEEELSPAEQGGSVARLSKARRELSYLQMEYELARRLNNTPLANTIAGRYESLTGQAPLQGQISSLHPGF
jgi:hypothetical protein